MTQINPMFDKEMIKNMRLLDINQRDINNHFLKPSAVPCEGCTACCRNFELVKISPEDDAAQYDTQFAQMEDGNLWHALKHKENGDCIYLENEKCQVYENRPFICRQFDCRFEYITGLFAPESFDTRQDHTNFNLRASEGEKRLPTLPAKSRRVATFIKKHKVKLLSIMQRAQA